MILEGHVAPPLFVATTVGRQRRVDVVRADRDQPAGEHRDVLVIDVERVERLRSLVRGPEELVNVVHLAVSEVVVEEQVEHVLAVARALAGDRHWAAVHGRIADHWPVNCAIEGDLPRVRGSRVQRAGVEELHRAAAATEHVAVDAIATEHLHVGIDLV